MFEHKGVDVRVEGVSKRYKMAAEEVHALRESTWAVRKGEAVAIMGPSGCGKTTLLNLLGDFTALENVMMPSLIARQPAAATRARAFELLERVGLKERMAHRPGELSGGEQQRVAVARALAQRPRLLLADEPTGNLDPSTGEDVQQLMLELNHEHGATLVVATHNDRLAAAMGRTLRLAGGRLHEVPSAAGRMATMERQPGRAS